MSSAICFNLDQSKILSSGNGLIQMLTKIDFMEPKLHDDLHHSDAQSPFLPVYNS